MTKYQLTCKGCGKDFEDIYSTLLYCSVKCAENDMRKGVYTQALEFAHAPDCDLYYATCTCTGVEANA